MPGDLPDRLMRDGAPTDTPAARYSFYGTEDEERARIEAALRAASGNMTRAARSLGMARNTLRTRLRLLDIGVPSPQR
jgi:transcriptional regulator of acetoin/glycerol metabolism